MPNRSAPQHSATQRRRCRPDAEQGAPQLRASPCGRGPGWRGGGRRCGAGGSGEDGGLGEMGAAHLEPRRGPCPDSRIASYLSCLLFCGRVPLVRALSWGDPRAAPPRLPTLSVEGGRQWKGSGELRTSAPLRSRSLPFLDGTVLPDIALFSGGGGIYKAARCSCGPPGVSHPGPVRPLRASAAQLTPLSPTPARRAGK